jgi:hypothetical protein
MKQEFDFIHQIPANNHYIYTNAFFQPFTLPIKGTYYYRSNLINIEENENTKAIEEFFGISIHEFVDCITLRRGIWDDLSAISGYYTIDRELIKSREGFNEEFLSKLGFIKKENRYMFPQTSLQVELVQGNKEDGFILYNESGEKLASSAGYRAKQTLMEEFLKHADWYLNVKEEHQTLVKLLEHASAMYIHEEIYEYVSKNEDERTLDAYDNLQELLEKYFELKDKKISFNEDMELYMKSKHPLGEDGYFNEFKSHLFGEWACFKEIFGELIEKKLLRSEFAKFMSFHWLMYDANRMYFPARTATEDNNDKEYKELIEKTLEVVTKRVEKRKN